MSRLCKGPRRSNMMFENPRKSIIVVCVVKCFVSRPAPHMALVQKTTGISRGFVDPHSSKQQATARTHNHDDSTGRDAAGACGGVSGAALRAAE